jgi:hypothetical protein
MSLQPNQISQLRRRFASSIRTLRTHEVLCALLLLIALFSLYMNGLGIHYASDDDVVISWWFHHDLFQSAEISAKSLGRFFFVFFAPVSSTILQIESDVLFNAIRLLPYVLGLLGFAALMNQIDRRSFPLLLTLAICLAFTPIWAGYTPVLGYPWWYSLGFAAFTWGALTWLKWFQTQRFRWALLTFLLITVALCTVEAFVPMLLVPAVVFGWRLTTIDRERKVKSWIRSGTIAAFPGVLALLTYIAVYLVFRVQNPSTYDGNRLSFAFPQIFVTWFQATVTPLPGWNFLRTNNFSSDFLALWNKLADFACVQPFYATKAFLVGLSVFAFYWQKHVSKETEKLPIVPLVVVCVIGTLSPNLLVSLTIKHQQAADLAYQPYFYSFYSLPFCLAGGLLLFSIVNNRINGVGRLVFIAGGVILAAFLSLSNDLVSSASANVLRENNLKWRAADHLLSSECLADLPRNALVYAPSLGWGANYWSNYFSTRLGRQVVISLDLPPNTDGSDEAGRFVFSYFSSPTNDGYFWQFGPLAADRTGNRKIQIGEYSRREKYRLSAFVATDESFYLQTNGKTYVGDKHSFDGFPIVKLGKSLANTFTLQVHSKGFPMFAATKEPMDGAKPVAPGTLLHFAKDGNGTECLLAGWSKPEAWGVWSEGDHAALAVPINSSGSDLVLEVSGSGFVNSKCPQQLVNVRVNEMPVGEILFNVDQPEGLRRLRIPAEVAQREPGGLLIDFRCENAISPKVAGISEDPRELALALRTLRITDQDFTK